MQANLPVEQRLLNAKKRLSELEKESRAPDLAPEKGRRLIGKINFRRSQIALLNDRLRLQEKQRACRKKNFSAEKTGEVRNEIENLLREKGDWGYNGRDVALVKKVVQKLKEGDVDPNMRITDRRYSRCSGPLPQVALSGRLYPKEELLRTLCELGADTEMPPEVLSKGSYHVRDLAGYLINGIDGEPHGSILFHTQRIDSENRAFFRELLLLGCGVNFKERATQQTPLHIAAIGDNAEAVKLLLQADAAVNVRDVWGETPLFNAARSVDPQIYHLLLAAGADPNLKNNAGKTAADCFPDGRLRRAVAAKDAGETLRALQDKADPCLVLASGDTLLAEACRIGFHDGVKLLAEHGADLNSRGRGRYSPLQYVYWSKGGQNEAEAFRIFKLLTELGAKTAINPPNYGGRTTLTDHTLGAVTWYRGTRLMEYLKYMLESGKFGFNPRSVVLAFERGNSAVLELLARKLPETDGDTARQILLTALRRKMPRKVIKPLLDRQRSPLPEEQLTEALKGNYADVIELFRGKISAAALGSLQQNADRRDSDKVSSGNGSAPAVNRRQNRRRR